MHPSRVLCGQKSRPQACPLESSTFQPSSSAYWIAFSISGFGENRSTTITLKDTLDNPIDIFYQYSSNGGWRDSGGCCGVYYHATYFGDDQGNTILLGPLMGGVLTNINYYYKCLYVWRDSK